MKNSEISVSSGPRLIYPLGKGMNMQAESCAGRPLDTFVSRHDPVKVYKWMRKRTVMKAKDEQMYKIPVTLRVNVGGLSGKIGYFRYKTQFFNRTNIDEKQS